MLQERRKALHERTAQAIESLYSTKLDDHYSELAHHYSRSGNTQKAVDYLHLAGQQAVQRSAYTEAIAHLTSALELLKALPDTAEHAQHEIILQTILGSALTAARGYAAPDVEKAYTRARVLCQQIGATTQLFPVLRGLGAVYTIRGELEISRELSERFLTLAQQQHDPAPLLWGHVGLGANQTWCGEFLLARDHIEQALAYYDPQYHRARVTIFSCPGDYVPRAGIG